MLNIMFDSKILQNTRSRPAVHRTPADHVSEKSTKLTISKAPTSSLPKRQNRSGVHLTDTCNISAHDESEEWSVEEVCGLIPGMISVWMNSSLVYSALCTNFHGFIILYVPTMRDARWWSVNKSGCSGLAQR